MRKSITNKYIVRGKGNSRKEETSITTSNSKTPPTKKETESIKIGEVRGQHRPTVQTWYNCKSGAILNSTKQNRLPHEIEL